MPKRLPPPSDWSSWEHPVHPHLTISVRPAGSLPGVAVVKYDCSCGKSFVSADVVGNGRALEGKAVMKTLLFGWVKKHGTCSNTAS